MIIMSKAEALQHLAGSTADHLVKTIPENWREPAERELKPYNAAIVQKAHAALVAIDQVAVFNRDINLYDRPDLLLQTP